eukprot:10030798-Karenia_brevis.AAC.1
MGPYRHKKKGVVYFQQRKRDGYAMDSQSVWYEHYCAGCFKRTKIRENEDVPNDQRCQEETMMKNRNYKFKCKVNGCQHYSVYSKTLEQN